MNTEEKLVARMYLVQKDGKEAYEIRMEGFGLYVDKGTLGSFFEPLLNISEELARKLPVRREPVAIVTARIPLEKSGAVLKRKYVKRDVNYWGKTNMDKKEGKKEKKKGYYSGKEVKAERGRKK